MIGDCRLQGRQWVNLRLVMRAAVHNDGTGLPLVSNHGQDGHTAEVGIAGLGNRQSQILNLQSRGASWKSK
jgi:hypothetical protein